MELKKGEKVVALVRLSLSTEKWLAAIYERAADIGAAADGQPLVGHIVRTSDGLIHYARRCLPIEEAENV